MVMSIVPWFVRGLHRPEYAEIQSRGTETVGDDGLAMVRFLMYVGSPS